MKSFASQFTYLLSEHEMRRNLRAFLRYLIALAIIVGIYSVLFHVVMLYAEGQDHSWLTGVYWTLTVMSTLGFGDITFHTDIGRLFSILVLLSGIVLLMIVLPFAFIRYFYAPWLEAQIRLRAPRSVPAGTRGHVVVCRDDEIGRGLARRLTVLDIPFFLLEPDATRAANLHAEGLPTVSGEIDAAETYVALGAEAARMVVVNLDDFTATNVILTIRENAPKVPILALCEDKDSIDILELGGATHVLPLKHRLGEQLAGRVNAGTPAPHIVGRFGDLMLAELATNGGPFLGQSIREIGLRQRTGLNIAAYWERGRLLPAQPDAVLSANSVAVMVGTESGLAELEALLTDGKANHHPVLVIGGGKVGLACARALKQRALGVHLIERDRALEAACQEVADRTFFGDAAALDIVTKAGIESAPSVVLTTNDDATNIYLAIYCRRLNPNIHIVSRISHERNLEAVHRAGANIALSYGTVGLEYIMATLLGREFVMLGEGVDVLVMDVPDGLAGHTLADSRVGAQTGLNVIGVEDRTGHTRQAGAGLRLSRGDRLIAIGTAAQRSKFDEAFG